VKLYWKHFKNSRREIKCLILGLNFGYGFNHSKFGLILRGSKNRIAGYKNQRPFIYFIILKKRISQCFYGSNKIYNRHGTTVTSCTLLCPGNASQKYGGLESINVVKTTCVGKPDYKCIEGLMKIRELLILLKKT
jgi:hypothetical protein